jgi:hypothetical protein
VDFPVPARPFSQKRHRSSCPSAQLYMSRRRSTRVSGRQVGSCCRWYALNDASAAVGRVLSTAFQSGLQVSLLLLRGHIGQAQTFLAPKVHGSLDFASNYLRVGGAHIADALSDACHGLRCGDNNTAFASGVRSALVPMPSGWWCVKRFRNVRQRHY